jgi:isopentenyl diphosphate isomerase/L-lactate dehydrogenase-like FMN-dependent dehydrogenase
MNEINIPLTIGFDKENVVGYVKLNRDKLPGIHNWHISPAFLLDNKKETLVELSIILDSSFRSYKDIMKGLPGHE